MAGIACCCLKTKIKISLFMKFNLSFGQCLVVHNRLYDVFVVYNQDSVDDESFVIRQIMPLLENYDLSFATEDSFTPGQDRFTSLQSVKNKSCTALIINMPDFFGERWKLYQLNQAICMQFEQTNFKSHLSVMSGAKMPGNFPKNLQLFLRTGSTVKQYTNWKGTLVYELKHKTKRSFYERLTFGNGPLYNNPQFVEMAAPGPQSHL